MLTLAPAPPTSADIQADSSQPNAHVQWLQRHTPLHVTDKSEARLKLLVADLIGSPHNSPSAKSHIPCFSPFIPLYPTLSEPGKPCSRGSGEARVL